MKEVLNNKYLYILPLAFFLLMRLPYLGADITNSDAGRWHRRSEKFLSALKAGDFAGTYQHYQPGITLMWLNAFVKQTAFTVQTFYTSFPKTLENADWYPVIHGISKAVLVVVLAGLLCFQIYAIKLLFGKIPAFFYGLLISTEPFVVGIDRWFHLTSLETYLAFASFLSILLWYKGYGGTKFLYVSADFLALSVLSKISSLILVPTILLILLAKSRKLREDAPLFSNKSLIFLRPLFQYAVTFFAICVILFPATWVNFNEVAYKIVSAVRGAVVDDTRALQIKGNMFYLYYGVIFALKVTPIFFLLSLHSVLNSRMYKHNHLLGGVVFYLLVYGVTLTMSDKKIDRYAIALIPPLILLTSVAIGRFAKKVQTILFVLIVSYAALNFFLYRPVFSSYYSPLFGGTETALKTGVYENSGEYFAQAADYLNEKGRSVTTFVPDNVESFSYYYKGNIEWHFTQDTDYSIQSLNIDRPEMEPAGCKAPVVSFGPWDKDVVYVFSCDDVEL
jgi:hypothetical protein